MHVARVTELAGKALQVYSGRTPVGETTRNPARLLRLVTKRRWIWGFWGALITMGGFWFRHSQRLIDFVSAECQVQGYPVTLVKPEPFFWTQHHRFRGGRDSQPVLSYSNRAGFHTSPHGLVAENFLHRAACGALQRSHSQHFWGVKGMTIHNTY